MRKEILISVEPQETRVAVVGGALLEEFYVERTESGRIVGNIYKGRVESITSGIGAAFIDTGMPKNGFLYVSDVVGVPSELEENVELVARKKSKPKPTRIEEIVKKDQPIMVQVTKEPFGTKGPRLTTKVSLPGRYLVLMPTDSHIGISKRIEDPKERQRLRQILDGLRIPEDMGLIVRTAAENKSKRDFIRDLRFLIKLWKRIESNFSRVQAPALLYREHGLVFRILRDLFTENVDKVIIDSRQEYKEALRYVMQLMPHMRRRVEFYGHMEPLFEKRHIEAQIDKLYNRKVDLKNGGYLIIEQTESLVAIDVNSGKYVGRKDIEETVFAVNMEAAKEVARQIKLRDLGGIIVIDFIDMKSGEHRKKVFRALEDELKHDKAKTSAFKISELGLVQMTRQRSRRSVESVAYQVCPYCQGKGATKSVQTMAITAIRKIKMFLSSNRGLKRIEVSVHPDVASRLFNEDRNSINNMERYYRAGINIKPNAALHIENVKVEKIA
jgi:ribonuclease G